MINLTTMLKSIFTIILLTLLNLALRAQTLVYSENFSGTSFPNYTLPNNSWTVSSTSPNTTIGSSGGQFAINKAYGSSTSTSFILTNVKASGYQNLRVSWSGKRTSTTPAIVLAYSLDGANFTNVAFTDVANTNTWAAVNGGTSIALPAAANNATQLFLRWSVQIGSNMFYSLDDLVITGTPEEGISGVSWANRPNNEDPFVVSSPTATTPYVNNNVTLRMTKQSAAGINLTTAVLSDATFQNPTRSLTLIQSGSTTTGATTITTNFSRPVEDLNFTLFDVDRTGGQYRDVVKIEGYLGNTLLPLQKSNVVTTNLNEFVEGTNTVQAVAAGTNAASNNASGNVTVKFTGTIDRLVITYSNADPASGSQGIGITSLNWRTNLAPLPVTLTAFKATLVKNQTELKWATASEKNNDKFLIERSQDGRTFETIGSVKGNGTTAATSTYSFTDAKPAQGTNYYRLKQVDFDGTSEFSKIVSVKNNVLAAELSIYPVPASTELNLSLPTGLTAETVRLLNLNGTLVKEVSLKNGNLQTITVPVAELPAGYYLVQVKAGQEVITKKIIKN